jgi:hypothetical protein
MDRTLIDAAAKRLAVEAVFLRRTQVRCKEDFRPPFIGNHLALVPQYRGGPTGTFQVVTATDEGTGETRKAALFYFAAGVRLIDAESLNNADEGQSLPDAAVYVEIECEFCAQYSVNGASDEQVLRPALDEFARYNVGYHVWPYWREYVQGTCARLGIPPVPVPMYRIPASDPEADTVRE